VREFAEPMSPLERDEVRLNRLGIPESGDI